MSKAQNTLSLDDIATELKKESMVTTHFEEIVQHVKNYTMAGLNVMLIGRHGIGKSAAITRACAELKLNMAYWSGPLMDPDIDLGGIPVPNKKTGYLEFFTNPDLESANVIFIDELNRASPRTLNMVFELVQFRSVHGKKLPNLRAIHTGINPPGGGTYDVQQLDDALLDRFHAYLNMDAVFPRAVILPILGEAKTGVMEQWYGSLKPAQYVAPRRMVYAAELHALAMPLAHAFLNPKLPVGSLEAALARFEVEKTGRVKAAPKAKAKTYFESEEYLAELNNPANREIHEEFTKYLEKQGITEEMLLEKINLIKAKEAELAAK